MSKRQIIKTINLNNGTLTYEVKGKNNKGHWYRNNKKVNIDNYRFYDAKSGNYRTLGEYGNVKPYIGSYDKIVKLAEESYNNQFRKDKEQSFKNNGQWIHLRTKGRMNLASIPVNLLDSIAINSGRSNTPFKQNLGLIAKESTFEGHSYYLDRAKYINEGMSKEEAEAKAQANLEKAYYSPWGLTNNHAYGDSRWADVIGPINTRAYDLSQKNGTKYYDELERLSKLELQRKANDKTPHYSDNIMVDAFTRYNAAPRKYNPGQETHVPMINALANEVFYEPQIQEYYKTRGKEFYNRGLAEQRPIIKTR